MTAEAARVRFPFGLTLAALLALALLCPLAAQEAWEERVPVPARVQYKQATAVESKLQEELRRVPHPPVRSIVATQFFGRVWGGAKMTK